MVRRADHPNAVVHVPPPLTFTLTTVIDLSKVNPFLGV
jgi:hypothetical protein